MHHDALIKGLESFINVCDMGMPVIYNQFSTVSGPKSGLMDGIEQWDGSPLPDSFFELLEDVSLYRHNFIPIMEERMAADEQLMRWISAEVGEGVTNRSLGAARDGRRVVMYVWYDNEFGDTKLKHQTIKGLTNQIENPTYIDPCHL